MLQLINNTVFSATCNTLPNAQGIDQLAVYVAAKFVLSNNQWVVADEQPPCPLADEHWRDNTDASIKLPSQISFDKPASDIIINGAAMVPNGQAVSALEVSIEIGNNRQSLIIYGDRHWHRGQITAPASFTEMPLIWENAFGGTVELDNQPHAYAPNPYGKGWLPKHAPSNMQQGFMLPNIEQPNHLINSIKDTPTPACWAPVSPHMTQRAQFAGTYDNIWQKTRAPFVPTDFSPQFFNAAVPSLQYAGFIQGGESIRLTHFHPDGELIFTLPEVYLAGTVNTHYSDDALIFKNSAVVIDTHNLSAQLFWVAYVPILRTQAEIQAVTISLSRKRITAQF